MWVDKFIRQTEVGTGRLSPLRLANTLTLELVVIDKVTDAVAEPAQEKAGRRRPMSNEECRLINDAKADRALRKNGAGSLAASARIEIVTMEKEQHDACPLDLF